MAHTVRERLLHMDQVATWTGVPIETLRYYRKVGTGPRSAKVGARVTYRESDVQAWIDEQFDQAGA